MSFKPAITLLQAMNDPYLFGPVFAEPSFWPWRAMAKLVDSTPLTGREIKLFEECTGRKYCRQARRDVSRRARHPHIWRRLFLLIGRRGGKDRFLSAVAVWRAALCANWNEHLSVGEAATVILVSTDKKGAAILRKYCGGLCRAPLLAAEVSRFTDEVIEFKNGSAIEIITNNESLIRGRSATAVLGTESCHWRTDESAASSDEEVVAAAEPSMSMCPDGGLLILASSVHRKRGFMFRQFQKLHGNEQAEDLVWFAPSRRMNERLPASIVLKAIENDAPRARAEYENVWRVDVDDFLPADVVTDCTDFGIAERPPLGNVRYMAFADAASGTGQDSFTLCIGHLARDEARSIIIDVIRERKPRFVAASVIREYAELLRIYRCHTVMSDNFAAGFSADEWARNGIQFRPCKNSTAQNYLCALPLMTSKRARLVDNPTLRTQLGGLERRVLSGHEVVDHAQRASAHDDIAAAVAGCLVELAAHPPMIVTAAHIAAITARGSVSGLCERAWLQRQRGRVMGYGFDD
jgi:hypothetical protein